MGTRG